MKKIMMTKYGFVRWPAEDFYDDGNRFTCYRVGNRVRVSKLVVEGDAYISAGINGTKLPYSIYSKLPHYKELDNLNGVRVDSLTEQDLLNLYEDCLEYEREYTEAENNVVCPTLDEIKAQYIKIREKRLAELAEIETLLAGKFVKLAVTAPRWRWTTIQEYLAALKRTTEIDVDHNANRTVNSSHSFDFVKPDYSDLKDSYYYRWLKETIAACAM